MKAVRKKASWYMCTARIMPEKKHILNAKCCLHLHTWGGWSFLDFTLPKTMPLLAWELSTGLCIIKSETPQQLVCVDSSFVKTALVNWQHKNERKRERNAFLSKFTFSFFWVGKCHRRLCYRVSLTKTAPSSWLLLSWDVVHLRGFFIVVWLLAEVNMRRLKHVKRQVYI